MRSFVVLAAFLALATANPLGLTRQETGNLVQGRNFLWQTRFRPQSPAQQAAQEIRQQIQKAQFLNSQQQDVNSIYAQDSIQSAVADQTAQNVIEQALLARQRQTAQSIQQLERQLDVQGVNGGIEQASTIEAVKNLQKWLQTQQLVAPQILVNSELTRTLETVIQAQLASDNVALNEVGTSGAWNTQAFQTRVQQLIDISNIREIEAEILNQQAQISQLQLQQQLVAEQIQQTQSQQTVGFTQLQNAVVELQQQGQRLIVEIVARQLVIQQLQQALVDQQQQLEQDIQQQVQGLPSFAQQTGFWGVSSGIQQRNVRDWYRQSGISSQSFNPFVGRWTWAQTAAYQPFARRQNVV